MSAARSSRPTRAAENQAPPTGPGPWPSALALAAVFIALLAIMGNFFSVKQVEVVGTNLPVAQIVATANVTGKNIFRVRADSIVARVDAMPAIEVSRVDSSFPGTVTIYASLRQAYAAWQYGSTTYAVDQTGRILGKASNSQAQRLTVVTGGASPPGFAVLQAARYAAGTLPSQADGALAQTRMDSHVGMTIIGKSGWEAVIGNGDPQILVQRVATLGALLHAIALKGQGLKYADLRYREPYYRPR